MNRALFPTQYEQAYIDSYRLYWSRANSPSADRLGNGIKAWIKMRHLRPETTILLGCIELYLRKIESTKQVRNNGRDAIVTYQFKPHFSSWLNDSGWLDFQEQATASLALSQIPATEAQETATRPSFKAHFYDTPDRTSPLKSRQQILDEHKARQQGA